MKQLEEFSFFKRITLSDIPNWTAVEPCVANLIDKGEFYVDCFDHFCNLRQFVERKKSEKDFNKLPALKKWTRFFKT